MDTMDGWMDAMDGCNGWIKWMDTLILCMQRMDAMDVMEGCNG